MELTDDAWRHYYAPALALEAGGRTVGVSEARAAADVEVEIRADVRERLAAGDWTGAHFRARETRDSLEEEGFRPDGLRVKTGVAWREERENPLGTDR